MQDLIATYTTEQTAVLLVTHDRLRLVCVCLKSVFRPTNQEAQRQRQSAVKATNQKVLCNDCKTMHLTASHSGHPLPPAVPPSSPSSLASQSFCKAHSCSQKLSSCLWLDSWPSSIYSMWTACISGVTDAHRTDPPGDSASLGPAWDPLRKPK